METYITEPTDYSKIASQMNISEFYFIRIFTIICGFTPGEYIRNRRLALAGSELASTDNKVIDIALKYGYDTPEGLTRTFTRFHGSTPNAVRKNKLPIKSFCPLHISISVKGGRIMNYRIVEKEAFTVLEKIEVHKVVTDENKNEISDFWDKAKADGTVETLVNFLADNENHLYGICYGETLHNKTFEYSIAARCKENCNIPDGFRRKEIPARKWIIFECVGAMPDSIQETWHKIITEFFPSADYEPTYEMNIEEYPDGNADSENYKSYIWIPIKKKVTERKIIFRNK